MTDFLTRLGTLSLGGGVAVLLLTLAGRMSRKRYAARWRCRAWGILCLLMVLPIPVFSLPIPVQTPSALIYLQIPSGHTVPDRPPLETGERRPDLQVNGGQADGGTSHPTDRVPSQSSVQESEPVGTFFPIPTRLLGLWLTGIAVLLVRHSVAHLRFCRWLRRWAVPVTDPETVLAFNTAGNRLRLHRRPALMRCPGLTSPMLCGLLRPLLLLPQEGPQGEALELTLDHELTHYRRRDVWRKALALLANAVHWFNPLMWWMVRRVEYDLELACDDAVLQNRGQAGRVVYGRTVLDTLEALTTRSSKRI